MTGWNPNMDEAPRGGEVETVTQVRRDGKLVDIKRTRWVSPRLIVAYDDTETGASKWLEASQRWEGFTAEKPPQAWMPYPVHPNLTTTPPQPETVE